jgi:hypothetical protein
MAQCLGTGAQFDAQTYANGRTATERAGLRISLLYGLIEILAGWRNWQTQRSQKPPRAISYRFDSDTRHHLASSPKINAKSPEGDQLGPRLILVKKNEIYTFSYTFSSA